MRAWLLLAVALLCGGAATEGAAAPAPKPHLFVVGNWSLTIDETGLLTGPGSDLRSEWDSPLPVARITIRRAGGPGQGWQVYIRRVDKRWPPGLTLQACLTDAGRGGTVSSEFFCQSQRFVTVGAQDALFFWGSGNPTDIGVALRLRGMSLDVEPGMYAASVVYTIVQSSP